MTNNKELQAVQALRKALDEKFGHDIIVMDLSEVSPIADYFVICTGNSAPQLHALAQQAEETMKSAGIRMLHNEGIRSGNWVLLDFGGIIVHLFDKESREYYNLERTWGDAKIID